MTTLVKDVRLPAEVVTLIVDALLSDVSRKSSLKTSLSILSSLALVCLSFRHIVNFVRFNAISLKVWIRPNVEPRQDRVSQLTALLDADTKVWEGKDTGGIRSTVAQHIKTLSLEVIVVSGGHDCDLRSLIPILSKIFQSRRTWKPSQYKALDLYQLDPQTLSLTFAMWGENESRPAKWTSINSEFTRFFEQFLATSTVAALSLKNIIHVPQALLHTSNFSSLALQNVKLKDRSPAPTMDPKKWNTLILVLDEKVLRDLSRTVAKVKKFVILSGIVLDDVFFPSDPTPTAVESLCIRMTSDTKKNSLFFHSYHNIIAPEARFRNVKSMLLDSTLHRTNGYSRTHHPFTLPIISAVERLEYQFAISIPRSVEEAQIVAYVSDLFFQYDITAIDKHVSSSLERPISRLGLVILHFYISYEMFKHSSADEDRRLRAELADLVSLSFSSLNAAQKLTLTVKFTIDDNGDSICRKRRADSSGLFKK